MATVDVDKVVIQREISNKVYVLRMTEREARELVVILGGTTGSIAVRVFEALDIHFPDRPWSEARFDHMEIGTKALEWAKGGDDGE